MYQIIIEGFHDLATAKAIAEKVNNGGAAFAAGIDIEVIQTDGPAHIAPAWTNRVTQKCEACNGFGYTDEAGDDECQACSGDGTVEAR